MRVLLIGPHPPPHGGISVHVSGIRQQLTTAGIACRVLDTGLVRSGPAFGLTALRHAVAGWTLHLHTNGHNVKSWWLALACGLAGQFRGGSILTLHSGMLPGYLESAPRWRRRQAALTCALYRQVICVSPEIRSALVALGVDTRRMEVLPAYLGNGSPEVSLDPQLLAWIGRHRPLFSTVLFFRPEYGFDTLVVALGRLRRRYPSFGCVVMGSGERRAEADRQVLDAGLEENMLLTGDVDHSACLALMPLCDAFLRPTLEDGDSISVREALALGVPVVASRAGTRPEGAILFRPGDVEEMAAKIELALATKASCRMQAAGSMDRLMEIYERLDGSEGSLCLN